MLISSRDIELLKLIAVYRYIPAGKQDYGISSLFGSDWLSMMNTLGFISYSNDKKIIRPRPLCFHLLKEAGVEIQDNSTRLQYNESVLNRAVISSAIAATFYMAGADIYEHNIQTRQNNSYVSSVLARRFSQGNLYSNTRFHGLYFLNNTAYMVFFVDDLGIHYNHELRIFGALKNTDNTAVIFMGKSTSQIAKQVFKAPTKNKRKKKNADGSSTVGISFGEAFQNLGIPVHFVPLGKQGALMLRFMQIDNYRDKTAKSMLRDSYKEPLEDMPDIDTFYHLEPFGPAVVTVDMDTKRIDRAVISTQNHGYKQLNIYALPEQFEYLIDRYAISGVALIDGINVDELNKVLNGRLDMYSPSNEVFTTIEGRYLSVEDFAGSRKVREPAREDL